MVQPLVWRWESSGFALARAEAEGRAYGGRMVFPDLVGLKTATKATDKSLGVLGGKVESVPLH